MIFCNMYRERGGGITRTKASGLCPSGCVRYSSETCSRLPNSRCREGRSASAGESALANEPRWLVSTQVKPQEIGFGWGFLVQVFSSMFFFVKKRSGNFSVKTQRLNQGAPFFGGGEVAAMKPYNPPPKQTKRGQKLQNISPLKRKNHLETIKPYFAKIR